MLKLSRNLMQNLITTGGSPDGNRLLFRRQRHLPVFFMLAVIVLLPSCSIFGTAEEEVDTVDGALIYYTEKEYKGAKPFKTRIFVTKDFLHMSDDRTAKGFVLYDRKKKIIYNVNEDDKSIMLIESEEVVTPSPLEINFEEKSEPSGAIPKVGDNTAVHYSYRVNGELCHNVVSLGAGFIPELSIAMTEFRTVLAGEHAKSIGGTPKEMLNACELAMNIYHPADHLKNGFPLREWNNKGYSRFIIYYRAKEKMKKKDLELPDGFKTFSISGK